MHFAKCSEILAALRVQFFFPCICDIILMKERRPSCHWSGIRAQFNWAGCWILGCGDALRSCTHVTSCPAEPLTARLGCCRVQSRRGAGFLFRKLVEKDEKQSFPVGEQSGIKRSGVQFELAYLEEYGQCEKTSESKPIAEGSFTLQNNFN